MLDNPYVRIRQNPCMQVSAHLLLLSPTINSGNQTHSVSGLAELRMRRQGQTGSGDVRRETNQSTKVWESIVIPSSEVLMRLLQIPNDMDPLKRV